MIFKSEKQGIGLGLHRSHCLKRIEVLLLIAALANYLMCLLGLQARQAGHEQRFQSNSLKNKRVLSLWRLGLENWRNYGQEIRRDVLEEIELSLRREVHQQAQELGQICGDHSDSDPFTHASHAATRRSPPALYIFPAGFLQGVSRFTCESQSIQTISRRLPGKRGVKRIAIEMLYEAIETSIN